MTSSLCCEICLEEFGALLEREPLLLPCAHTFCRSCLTTIAEKCEARYIPCPKCRRRANNDINELQKNFMLIPNAPREETNLTLFLEEVASVNAFGTLLVHGNENQKTLAVDNLKVVFETFRDESVVLASLIPSLIAALKAKDNGKASIHALKFISWWLDFLPGHTALLQSERFLTAIASHQILAYESKLSPYSLILQFVKISEENALALAKSTAIAQIEVSMQFEDGSTQQLALCILVEIAKKSELTRLELVKGAHLIETVVYCINSRSFLEKTTQLVIAMSESPAIALQIVEHEGLSCLISLLPLRHNSSDLPILRALAKLLSVQQSWASHFLDAPVIMYFTSTIHDSTNSECRKQCAVMLEMLVKEKKGDELFDRFEIISLCSFVIQQDYVSNRRKDTDLLLLVLGILLTLTKRSRFQMEVTGYVEMMIKLLNDNFACSIHELVIGILTNISSQVCSLPHSFCQIQGVEAVAHLLTMPSTSVYCTELVLAFIWTLLSSERSFVEYTRDSLVIMNALQQQQEARASFRNSGTSPEEMITNIIARLQESFELKGNFSPVDLGDVAAVDDSDVNGAWRVLSDQQDEVEMEAEKDTSNDSSPTVKRTLPAFLHSVDTSSNKRMKTDVEVVQELEIINLCSDDEL